MPLTSKAMVALLLKNGFVEVTGHGSHRKFYNPATGKKTIVPYHSGELGKGLEQAILKQAGLKK